MGTYVHNMVLVSKEVYEQSFKSEKSKDYEDYNLLKFRNSSDYEGDFWNFIRIRKMCGIVAEKIMFMFQDSPGMRRFNECKRR